MPAAHARNVALTPELTRFVDDMVAGGSYNNASEVVQSALREGDYMRKSPTMTETPSTARVIEIEARIVETPGSRSRRLLRRAAFLTFGVVAVGLAHWAVIHVMGHSELPLPMQSLKLIFESFTEADPELVALRRAVE